MNFAIMLMLYIYEDKELLHMMKSKSKELAENYSLDAVLSNTVNIICNENKSHI